MNSMNRLHAAARMAEIAPFQVMALLAQAQALEAAGRDIVHLEIGEPDFPTPPAIVAAGMAALSRGDTFYTPAQGLPSLRAAIADDYARRFGAEVAPDAVFVTPGASGALLLALASILDPGDEVLLSDPGYPCNRHFVRLLEGLPRAVPVDAASGYQLTADLVERHWSPRTRAVLLSSPGNPSGTLVSAAETAAIAQVVAARGGVLIVDEIYQGLTYDVPSSSVLALDPAVIVVNSFSKYFQMTGWRLGWAVMPEPLRDAATRLAQNLFLAAPTPAQHAALAAFAPDTLALLEQRRAAFQARRDFLLPALRSLGFKVPVTPQGAFYIYADCTALAADGFALSQRLLTEAGVAITPGNDFGDHCAAQHVRLAYTRDLPVLAQAVERIGAWLKRG